MGGQKWPCWQQPCEELADPCCPLRMTAMDSHANQAIVTLTVVILPLTRKCKGASVSIIMPEPLCGHCQWQWPGQLN